MHVSHIVVHSPGSPIVGGRGGGDMREAIITGAACGVWGAPGAPAHPMISMTLRKKNLKNRKMPLILCFSHKTPLEKDDKSSTRV